MNKLFLIFFVVFVATFAGLALLDSSPEDMTEVSIISDREDVAELLAHDLEKIIENKKYGAHARKITVNELSKPGAVVLEIEIPEYFNSRDYLNRVQAISSDVMHRAEAAPEIGRVVLEFKGPMQSGELARFVLLTGITGEGRDWKQLKAYTDPEPAIRAGFEVRYILPDLEA